MIKNYDVSNIKTLLFFDPGYDSINHRELRDYVEPYVVAFNNITALSFDDKKCMFTIKSDDFDYPLHSTFCVYVIKADQNKHDDFDENSYHVINVREIQDFVMYTNLDELDHIETKYVPDDEMPDGFMQEVYLVAKNGNKHFLIPDEDDCGLYEPGILDDDDIEGYKTLSEIDDSQGFPTERDFVIVDNKLVQTDVK